MIYSTPQTFTCAACLLYTCILLYYTENELERSNILLQYALVLHFVNTLNLEFHLDGNIIYLLQFICMMTALIMNIYFKI